MLTGHDQFFRFSRIAAFPKKADSRAFGLPGVVPVGWCVSDVENSLCDQRRDRIREAPASGADHGED
jgi:hypothetical protein